MSEHVDGARAILSRMLALARDESRFWKPFLMDVARVTDDDVLPWWERDGARRAHAALRAAGHYAGATTRAEWVACIGAALSSLGEP